MKTIWERYTSRIDYDKKNKRCIKYLKTKKFDPHNVKLYKKLCEMNPYVVKMYNAIDDTTYDMQFIPNILGPVSKYFNNHECTKQEYIDLFNLINSVWSDAMKISSTLKGNDFFIHDDFKLDNIIVYRKGSDGIGFKLLDCDCWRVMQGYNAVDTYYQTMFQMALIAQRTGIK
tara:strand:+ start:1193 stop:1711 length:519 start_codon:yes stop_codon:yes gene_type:complete